MCNASALVSALSSLSLKLPRVTLALLLAACGGKTESAASGNGLGGSSATGGATSSGGAGTIPSTCVYVPDTCPYPDIDIAMNPCPAGRDCYLRTAGCWQGWCLRPITTNDAGNPLDASALSGGASSTGGAPSTGGASGIGGSTSSTGGDNPTGGAFCMEGPTPPICSDDTQCSQGAYCGGSFCAQCSDFCTSSCAPYQTRSCGAANTALSDQLTGDNCTVIVRVNAKKLVVTDYAVNCGPLRDVVGASLLNGLLQMNSIDWANAASITDPTKTGLFAYQVDNGSVRYTAYFSAETGNQLLVTEDDGSELAAGVFYFSIAWFPASDLGTTCAPGRQTFPSPFGILDATSNLSAETAPLVATDLFHIIRTKLGDVRFTAVTGLLGTEPEFVFFITAD